MSKKGKIGKIYFSSKIREGGNMSKIGKKGNVADVTAQERLGATRKVLGWEVVATGEHLFFCRSNTANIHSI